MDIIVALKPLVERRFLPLFAFTLSLLFNFCVKANDAINTENITKQTTKKLVYIMPDISIPFWKIMGSGVQSSANSLGYRLTLANAGNSAKHELEHVIKAIRENVSGIIISPTTSAAGATAIKIAKNAGIPVVIADIGADSSDYVSYISSDNKQGAYELGKILAEKIKSSDHKFNEVGIIAIPQKRANGRARTIGFMQAMHEADIKAVGIFQQVTFSYQETYDFSATLIQQNPELGAIWLQGSDKYQAALDAINKYGKKNDIALICFDSEPAFLDLIPQGIIAGAAMQQPYLMGEESVIVMHSYLTGKKVIKEYTVPILAISQKNISKYLHVIKRNVLNVEFINRDHNVKN